MGMDGQGRLSRLKSRTALEGMDRRFFLALRCGIYLLLGLLLSMAQVLEQGAPLGMALVAAASPGLAGVFALVGAALGYLIGGGLDWGIRYIASSVLIYTIAFIFQELKIFRQSFFMPACTGLVMAMTGFLDSFSLSAASALPLAAELFLETVLAFGGCYFFREALLGGNPSSEGGQLRYSISLMITISCLLMSLSGLELFQMVSLGRVLALLLLMAAAMKGGMLTGAATGTVLGLSMDIAGSGSPFYTMAYAFSGLLSGVFGRHGRVIFVLSFILAGALAVVCAWEEPIRVSALFESFCASVIFMVLPGRLLSSFALLQDLDKGSGEAGLRRFVARRVQNLSEAYGDLFEMVRKNMEEPYNDENIARVFDRAADQVCVGCKNKNLCWNQDYVDTLSAMNDATKAMMTNGSLAVQDLPGFFRERCVNLPAFVTAVNGELRSLSYRRQLRLRLSENRSVAWGQYLDVSQVLSGVAGELCSANGAEPLIEQRLLRYLKGLEIDAEAAVYRDGSGRLRMILDGDGFRPLMKDPAWLEKLSEIAGVRLCTQGEPSPQCARLSLLEAEPLAVSVGISAMKKKGEAVSGDRGSYFKTDAGVLCVILSDGMGCGDEAARDSDQVVSILEKFLRSGLDPAVAMKILNSVMLLKSADSWGYATVDLMCVDLFSGETSFYKYGAAPSYVKNGKTIRRIKGESLAPGLGSGEGCAPDLVRMRLRPGSTALIASDGVIADSEDSWLRELLQKGMTDMKALARQVLQEAETRYGSQDDMTVLTVRVEERA